QENNKDSEEIRKRCGRFRTLVIGRANAGKTTVLQKVCGTTKRPVVYNARGEKVSNSITVPMKHLIHHLRGLHDINDTMVFESTPGFIFHDSQGFEAGGAQYIEDVKAFLSARASTTELQDQVHAVWQVDTQ
ncbi:hypothetical protein FIBSPDRAFT_763243, partial [Athelia psychrophila]